MAEPCPLLCHHAQMWRTVKCLVSNLAFKFSLKESTIRLYFFFFFWLTIVLLCVSCVMVCLPVGGIIVEDPTVVTATATG